MKNRPARVRELIQRELGTMIAREMTFDATLVTVQGVDLTADFKHCHVHIGVMGTEREQRDAIHQLAERRPFLQHELSKRVVLKFTPQLHFHLDNSVARGTKVMEILRQIDVVTPPESAEAAARRTQAYADGDTDALTDLDAEEADTLPTPEEADEAEAAGDEEDAEENEETKDVRNAKDAKGRSKQDGKPRHDPEDHDDDHHPDDE